METYVIQLLVTFASVYVAQKVSLALVIQKLDRVEKDVEKNTLGITAQTQLCLMTHRKR